MGRIDVSHPFEGIETQTTAEHDLQDARIDHHLCGGGGSRSNQQLEQLVAYPLCRELVQELSHARAVPNRLGIKHPSAVAGMKPEEAQNSQVVLQNSPARLADKSHLAQLQISISSDEVVNPAAAVAEQRIHREVATQRVCPPVVGEFDPRAPSESFRVDAKRGDLEYPALDSEGDRPVADAGRMDRKSLGSRQFGYRRRIQRGCNVDVVNRHLEQSISHRAAGHPRFAAPV